MNYLFILFIIIYYNIENSFSAEDHALHDETLNQYTINDISNNIKNNHILVGLNLQTSQTLLNLQKLYQNHNIDFGILIGNSTIIKWKLDSENNQERKFALFKRVSPDRKCLMKVDFNTKPRALHVDGNEDLLVDLITFINTKCFLFIALDGKIDKVGIGRERILKDLYHVSKSNMKCETISLDSITKEEFVEKYVFRSKPVIIKNAIKQWPAFTKWTNNFLRQKYREKYVHVKLTEHGEFEGCDKANKFDNYDSFKIPNDVIEQLLFPDLVVVRPAVGNFKFSTFLNLVENTNNTYNNISAYLEYSSIREYFSDLENDLDELPLVKDTLRLLHLNLWLSNGKTLGKLHFDPFDNFLCQMRGSKHLTLFDPHNNYNLYEGHIQEAILSFDYTTKKFRNSKLLDSTSMVMSPINIKKPDLKRFSNFSRAHPLDCMLNEGDVLYMPSFWWHEVQSHPNEDERRNLAVNFWYEPFLQKEFPCSGCKFDVNPAYRTLLEKFAES